ncbi:hypothetical protein V8E55_009579 [Tylopilus felleus]
MSTEHSFRTNLSQFRWARGVTDDSQQAQPAQSSNPFSRFYNAIAAIRSEEKAWFALLVGFGACLIGACVCFISAFLGFQYIPQSLLSMGSILVMAGFSVLVGPINHITYLVSKERLPFLAVCFSSLARTLYFALGISTGTIPRLPTYMTFLGPLLAGLVHVCRSGVYVLAYSPGGTRTLHFGGQIDLRGTGSLLPV